MLTFESKLIEKQPRVADITSFRFKRPEAYRFQAGQWFVVSFPSSDPDEPYEHHFSHSDAPSKPFLEFTTRLRGSEFKNALDALPIGAPVTLEGPYGSFTLPSDVERAAFLCGGIGITCVRSILRWVAEAQGGDRSPVSSPNPDFGPNSDFSPNSDPGAPAAHAQGPGEVSQSLSLREAVLFFANQSEDAIPFRSELEELGGTLQGFRTVHVLSRAGDSWPGYRGHLNKRILAGELGTAVGWHYFVSGPPSFDSAMQQVLTEWGVIKERIKTEQFMGY